MDHAAAQTLSKEARRWATKIAREINTYRESNRKLNALQALRDSGQKVNFYFLFLTLTRGENFVSSSTNWFVLQTDPNDPNGPDLETKIEELRQTMRKAEVKFWWIF